MADIRDKIRKLLALSTSSNENEARAALLKAKKLMAENKISESEIEVLKKQKLVHLDCEEIEFTTNSKQFWIIDLAEVICQNFLCASSWTSTYRSHTNRLRISGLEDDAKLCKDIMEFAFGFIRNNINEHIKAVEFSYLSKDEIKASYGYGFVMGLKDAYKKQEEEHKEWALILYKPKEVEEYLNSLNKKDVMGDIHLDSLVGVVGYEDGINFNSLRAIQ